jgi:hypothetical protein
LCNTDYQAFLREWRRVPEERRDAFVQELIESNLLLPKRSPGYKAKPNQFSIVAEKYKPYDS